MGDNTRQAFRSEVLGHYGASGQVEDELLAYNECAFPSDGESSPPVFPLPDEEHLRSWSEYEQESREVGVFEALKRRFVQLRFPIRSGISQEDAYRKATRRGLFAEAEAFAPGLALEQPSQLQLHIHPTMAGRIPVLVAKHRDDFVSLVQAFTDRNEPVPVPDAMGACIVNGFNNWDRVAAYRTAWERKQSAAVTDDAWAQEFRNLVPRKALYQDRFIILSRGPYSATAAAEAGLEDEEWLERSLTIRREHEFTHYFTYRLTGVMRSNIFDELIADFVGLTRAFGAYRADLALRFLGLESFPQYRTGGRLDVYRGAPPLSDDSLEVLKQLTFHSVRNLESVSVDYRERVEDLRAFARLIFALSNLTLEELASREMLERVVSDLH
jgi:hypothetical protein